MATVQAALRKLRWSVTHRGVAGTVRFALGRLTRKGDNKPAVHPFDVAYGTDTSGLIGGADLQTGHAHDVHNTAYYGMSPSRLKGALERWRALPRGASEEDYTFVDLGCGKGRAVMLAAEERFREVVGVELHPELARVAEENLRLWVEAGRARSQARIVRGDATEVELPEGPLLIYLFNPFGEFVIAKLLERMERSLRGREGVVDLIYFNPQVGEMFERSGFELVWSETIAMSEEDAAADLVASPDDLCNGYRWVGRRTS